AHSRTAPPACTLPVERRGSIGGNATRPTRFSAATVPSPRVLDSPRRARRPSAAPWPCSRWKRPPTRSCTKPITGRTGSPSRSVASSALRRGLASGGLGWREHHRLDFPAVLVEIDEQAGFVEKRRRLAGRRRAGGTTPAVDDRRADENARVRFQLERTDDVGAKPPRCGETEIDRHAGHSGRCPVAFVDPLHGIEPVDLLVRGASGIAVAGSNGILRTLTGDDTAPVGGDDRSGPDDEGDE